MDLLSSIFPSFANLPLDSALPAFAVLSKLLQRLAQFFDKPLGILLQAWYWRTPYISFLILISWTYTCLFPHRVALSIHAPAIAYMAYAWIRKSEGQPITWIDRDQPMNAVSVAIDATSLIYTFRGAIECLEVVMELFTWQHPSSPAFFSLLISSWLVWITVLTLIPVNVIACAIGALVICWNSLLMQVIREQLQRIDFIHKHHDFVSNRVLRSTWDRVSKTWFVKVVTRTTSGTADSMKRSDSAIFISEQHLASSSDREDILDSAIESAVIGDYTTDATPVYASPLCASGPPTPPLQQVFPEPDRNVTLTPCSKTPTFLKVWENERWWLGLGHRKHFLPHDPPEFTDMDGIKVNKLEDLQKYPILGKTVKIGCAEFVLEPGVEYEWKWVGDWRLENDQGEGGWDGWWYGKNDWTHFKKHSTINRLVRRRCWVREAVLCEVRLGLAIAQEEPPCLEIRDDELSEQDLPQVGEGTAQ